MVEGDDKEVVFLCDGHACGDVCPRPWCRHTAKVENAAHFAHVGNRHYEEEGLFGIGPDEYQRRALYYERGMDVTYPRLLNGLMGLNGEAGEAIDLLKKATFQGHDLDKVHLAKELGDVLWYVALSADALGFGLEEIMIMNLDKLAARYPHGFDSEKSVSRAEGDV